MAGNLFFLTQILFFGSIAFSEFPLYKYFESISCIFLTISAGLFLTNKEKLASIVSLIGLGMLSKSILIIWFTAFKFPLKFYLFALIPSTILFLLFYISIRAIYTSKILPHTILNWHPSQPYQFILAATPTIILIGLILALMTFKRFVFG